MKPKIMNDNKGNTKALKHVKITPIFQYLHIVEQWL